MNILQLYGRAILNRLAFGRKQTAPESAIIQSRLAEIDDGVTYALPHLLPGYLRESLEHHGVLEQYMQEAARDTSLNFQFDSPAVRDPQFIGVYEDSLLEMDHATREYVLSNTHAAYARNPLVKRCVHYVSSFVIGNGFNLHCQNKEVERILNEFIEDPDNAIREYERQAIRDLVVDGELFLRFFKGRNKDGGVQIVAVPLRPWEIRYIETEEGFFRRRISYRWQRYGQHNRDNPNAIETTEPKDIKAAEIIHVAINKHAYELRGRSEIYPALPWIKARKDWLENRARQNAHRGSLLWWVRIKNALPGVISAKIAQYSRPFRPGSIAVTTDNEEFQALTNPVGASDAGEDGRQLLIMVLNGIGGLPEYMLGDGQNANLASTKSQQLPALTTFSEFQTIFVEQVLVPMFKRVLEAKIEAGEIAAMVDQEDSDGEPIMVPVEEDEGADGYQPEPESVKPTNKLAAAIQEAEELVLKIAKKEGEPEPGEQTDPTKPQPPAMPPVKPMLQRKAEQIDTLKAFTVDYEPLDEDDPKNLADALAIAEDHEWLAKEEAATRFGVDYTIQRKKIKLEKAERMNRQAQGLEPQPVGMIPPGMEDEEQGDGKPPFGR